MSALPPKADIRSRDRHVRFVPKADMCTAAKTRLFETDAQVLEDAERLIDSKWIPTLFSPIMGAAIAASYWFVSVRCCPRPPYPGDGIEAAGRSVVAG
jgi:hypothetical protein